MTEYRLTCSPTKSGVSLDVNLHELTADGQLVRRGGSRLRLEASADREVTTSIIDALVRLIDGQPAPRRQPPEILGSCPIPSPEYSLPTTGCVDRPMSWD